MPQKNEVVRLTNPQTVYNSEDYTQSSNALFHFMNKQNYLETALFKKALVPRFCLEDIGYLNLSIDDQSFKEIAVLQKCFCDIPLHKIIVNFGLELTETSEVDSNDLKLIKDNTHPGYYGEYAIAFSKAWCEDKNLQPIHYLNETSSYTKGF